MNLSIDERNDYLLDEESGKLWHYDGRRHVPATAQQYQRILRRFVATHWCRCCGKKPAGVCSSCCQ